MTDYGLKVSQDGIDVGTAADDDLAFSSEFNTLKIYQTGTIEITTDGSGNASSFATHDLDFAPAFKAFLIDGTTYHPDLGTVNRDYGNDFYKLHVYTDADKIYFQASGATATTTYEIAYFLFADLAQTYSSTSAAFTEDYGLKVSQDGVNVLTAEPYELVFSSSLQTAKFDPSLVGSFTLSLGAKNCTDSPNTQSTSQSIAHGLGYPPLYLTWVKSNNSQVYPAANTDKMNCNKSLHSSTTDAGIWVLESRCNSTNIIWDWYREASCITGFIACDVECVNWNAETITVYYYIFRENLSLI